MPVSTRYRPCRKVIVFIYISPAALSRFVGIQSFRIQSGFRGQFVWYSTFARSRRRFGTQRFCLIRTTRPVRRGLVLSAFKHFNPSNPNRIRCGVHIPVTGVLLTPIRWKRERKSKRQYRMMWYNNIVSSLWRFYRRRVEHPNTAIKR